MSAAADTYFDSMSSQIPAEHRQAWENEINTAEAWRMTDPSAMDILAARPSCNTAGGSRQVDEQMTPTEEIVVLILSIEEQQ